MVSTTRALYAKCLFSKRRGYRGWWILILHSYNCYVPDFRLEITLQKRQSRQWKVIADRSADRTVALHLLLCTSSAVSELLLRGCQDLKRCEKPRQLPSPTTSKWSDYLIILTTTCTNSLCDPLGRQLRSLQANGTRESTVCMCPLRNVTYCWKWVLSPPILCGTIF